MKANWAKLIGKLGGITNQFRPIYRMKDMLSEIRIYYFENNFFLIVATQVSSCNSGGIFSKMIRVNNFD